MSDPQIALTVAGVYLAITLVMGIMPARRVSKSVAGYVAADRSMNVFVLYFVLGAAIFSSFAFLGGPGRAYSRGAAAFFILGYGILGMVPFYFFGPRAHRLGGRFGFVTQAELLAHRFGSRSLSMVLALVSVAAFVPYLTLQMKGAGLILDTLSEGAIKPWVGALITYAVVLVYVFASGVLGVGWTNTFQGIFMMAIAWFLGLYLPSKLHGGVGPMFEAIADSDQRAMLEAPGLAKDGSPWHWWGYSSDLLVSAIGFSVWPHLFMKSFAARSARAIKLTVVLYPTFQLFLVPIMLVGFAAVMAFPGVEDPDTILPYVLTHVELSPILVGLVTAGALAASMSSGDTILHAAASIGVRDGIKKIQGVKLRDATERLAIRVLVIGISALAFYFAVASEVEIVKLLLAAYGGIAQIFPITFAAFFWPRATRAGALSGLVAGLAVNTLFLTMPELKPVPVHEGVYGLAANIFLLVAVSLRTRPEPWDKLRHYCSFADSGNPSPEAE